MTTHRPSLPVLVAAWAVPVFVLGQFAFVAIIPIAITLVAALRDPAQQALRWSTGALTAVYAVLVTAWLAGPSTAPSLSKFLSPTATALFAATATAVAITHHTLHRRPRVA
ncbi:hypothetical protein [Actinokineospora cianjurensis]|uniref:Uncharacterized protein n=1 Tax=Actinokineospora cianjurensis TaxID=585224 RepID=A0A421B2P5_9PSEU|nr:hypothetical protein [Actinokineospora cianjurensis]RLK58661.1 hypothetical protein CLV68_3133 [Actinokineospora cianjurensis]